MLKNKPWIGVVIVIVALGAAVGMWTQGRSPSIEPAKGQYFLDLGNGQLFTAPLDAQPPIDSAIGGAGQGVRAHVYTCGQCTESQWKVLYLETLTEKARAAAAGDSAEVRSVDLAAGVLVAAMPATLDAKPRWVVRGGPESPQLETAFLKMCDGRPARRCVP